MRLRMRKSLFFILFTAAFLQSGLCQSSSPSYYMQDEFSIASPGAYKYGLLSQNYIEAGSLLS